MVPSGAIASASQGSPARERLGEFSFRAVPRLRRGENVSLVRGKDVLDVGR